MASSSGWAANSEPLTRKILLDVPSCVGFKVLTAEPVQGFS